MNEDSTESNCVSNTLMQFDGGFLITATTAIPSTIPAGKTLMGDYKTPMFGA